MFREMEQGQAGTCHTHAAVAASEDTALANGLEPFPICRRLTGWQGMQIAGGGNMSDGNSPTNDILALSNQQGGVGAAHESLCPYTDDYYTLGSQPDASVFADAKPVRVVQPVDVDTVGDDASMRLLANKHAVYNGIWWPFGWDDQQTFMTSIGSGEYGHALEECGYAQPGVIDQYGWYCLRNWHGKLYPPLPLNLRAKIPGYPAVMPALVTEFWVRQDIYSEVRAYGNAERGAVTDLTGLAHLFDLSGVLADVIRL
jgi:hypothetical protein